MSEVELSERDQRVERLSQALLFALMTANEQPYPLAVPAARNVAAMMDDLGWRESGERREDVSLPGWLTERVREESQPVPVEPDHHAPQETSRLRSAPKRPSRIAKKYMGVPKNPGA